ncbi:MAG: hypothetical protein HUJ29_12855 [Gammaproteobacteria bacterium]|nr:hypothetical protein [Gammaproteobacteria bacterium]
METDRIPGWANWIAQDPDGTWWAYKAEPLQMHMGWYENEIGIYKRLTKSPAPSNWKKEIYRIK